MIRELHGKRYYMEFDNDRWDDCFNVFGEILDSEIFKDENFCIQKIDDKYIIYSISSCGTFRGPKYQEWERIKRLSYKLKKGA